MALTLAVSFSVVPPAALTVTTSVTVKLAPLLRLLTLQLTVPALPTAGAVQLPCVALTLEKTVPVGSVSLATTPLATPGPPLVTVNELRLHNVVGERTNQRVGLFGCDPLDAGAVVAHDV